MHHLAGWLQIWLRVPSLQLMTCIHSHAHTNMPTLTYTAPHTSLMRHASATFLCQRSLCGTQSTTTKCSCSSRFSPLWCNQQLAVVMMQHSRAIWLLQALKTHSHAASAMSCAAPHLTADCLQCSTRAGVNQWQAIITVSLFGAWNFSFPDVCSIGCELIGMACLQVYNRLFARL